MKNKIMTQKEFLDNWKRGKEMMDQLGPAKTTDRILTAIRGIIEHNSGMDAEELNKQFANAIYQILQENQRAFFGTSTKKIDINTDMVS